MQHYINKYDSFDKIIVYDFKLHYGGLGDCIKFFMFILNLCIKNDIKLYYLKNDIFINNYLKLKYEKMYITLDNIINYNKIKYTDTFCITPNVYNIISPSDLYDDFNYKDTDININEVFEFNDSVKINSEKILLRLFNEKDNNYISIHLRLGDTYLETEKKFINCYGDKREYNEEKLYNFIENMILCNENILFFCDNNGYKLKIKEKYNSVMITDLNIGHTGLINTTEKPVLDTITEFYLMTNSKKIFMASKSGFPKIASKFNNIPCCFI